MVGVFPNLPGGSALSDSGASVPCHLIYQIFEGIFNDRSPIPLNGYEYANYFLDRNKQFLQ
ncbi:MAG: hypothetical protein HC847_19755 [Hydrococcus sp. RU_2_2]|nr:hypothetical protein [Hydrococcus sp. RU_2_2]